MKVCDLIRFNEEGYFNGAVQTEWFYDKTRVGKIASSYVFHGPKYFGVSSQDVSQSKHKLIDTASFTKILTDKVYSKDRSVNNFVLTIAGYGTGKSHLAVCLGALFSGDRELAARVANNISEADSEIGAYIKEINTRANLIIVLNGMNNFNLDAEILKCARLALDANGISDDVLRSLTKSYEIIRHFVERNYEVYQSHFESSAKKNGIILSGEKLKQTLLHHAEDDHRVVSAVNEVYREVNGDSIHWDRGLSAGDVLSVLQDELCGDGKPFNKIIVFFDEFGRYIEYAAANPTIAGEASLQQIFEAVQSANGKIIFTGFIQSDLNAYLSRIEKTSNIIRYIGRYENSEKLYLSSNFETILANLLKKNDDAGFSRVIGNALDRYVKFHERVFGALERWDKTAQKKSVWTSFSLYRKTILEGCYPLHPITTWLLSNTSSWMQQRSTIAFAAEMFASVRDTEINGTWLPYVYPIDIVDSSIYDEMLNSEEKGLVQSQFCMLYRDILVKISNKLSDNELSALKAVLVINIARFSFRDKEDAQLAIRYCSNLKEEDVAPALKALEDMHGVVAYDENSNTYDLIAEASGFNEFKRVYSKYRIGVDASIEDIDSDLLKETMLSGVLETSFGQEKMVSSTEWVFEKRLVDAASIDSAYIGALTRSLDEFNTGEEPRGFLIYAYCNDNAERVIADLSALYKKFSLNKYAIIILFLDDSENAVIDALKIKKTISRFSKADQERFQKHVSAQIRAQNKKIVQSLAKATTSRIMITGNGIEHYDCRLNVLCSNRFKELYPSTPPFMFDGFQNKTTTQAKKYLTNICIKLFDRTLMNIQSYQAMTRDEKNRINAVMAIGTKTSWQVFSTNCTLVTPRNETIKEVYESLSAAIQEDEPKGVYTLLEKYSKAPYGMNLNALALFVFYYIAERGSNLYCYYGSDKLNAALLSDKIFKANKLQPNEFRRIRLQINKDAEIDKLAEICKEAATCRVIDDCPEFKKKINTIANQEGISPENQTMYAQTTLRIDEGIRLLNVVRDREQKARELIEEAKKTFVIHKFVKVFDYLTDYSKPLSEEYGLYCGDSVIRKIIDLRTEAEQILHRLFPTAITRLRCDITQLSQVKGLYKNVADILRNHGFEDYANQTTERINSLEAELRAKQKYESSLAELEKDLTMFSDISVYSYKGLVDVGTKMSSWQQFIKGATGLPQAIANQLLVRIQTVLDSVESHKNSLLKRVSDVSERIEFACKLEDLCTCEEELIRLKAVQFDTGTEEALDNMLESIKPRIQTINNLPLVLDQLYALRSQQEWNSDKVMTTEIIKRINALELEEKNWISINIEPTENDISGLSASSCVSWLEKTEVLPGYISSRTRKNYTSLRERVVAQLRKCRIDGVVTMFSNLSDDEKRQCLEIIQKII